MKTAFSQNGRRNIAVVVDLLFLNQSLCAITTPVDAVKPGLPVAGNRKMYEGKRRFLWPLNAYAEYFRRL